MPRGKHISDALMINTIEARGKDCIPPENRKRKFTTSKFLMIVWAQHNRKSLPGSP